jgi:serine/threonine protein kinase
MSAVYQARDPNLRRTVAIKLIHPHLASDPEFVRRFEEEAAAVAGLRHPNIVQVFDFNHDADTYYMVLEFVSGQSLQEKLRGLHQAGERLSAAETVRIMTAVCEAVSYAHERGLIHRDLKPANVMINTADQPVLMDFGVAKIVGGKQFTATGAVIGTPAYIAPELVRGQRPDQRADIYSLGVMLFEMLAGQLPFDADSAMSLMMKHVTEPPPDLRQLVPRLPRAIVSVVERALEKDPANRFQSAAEMAQALRAAFSSRAPSAPASAAAAPRTAAAPATQPATPPSAKPKPNMTLMFGGIGLLGLCGLIAVVAIVGSLAINSLGAGGTSIAASTASASSTLAGTESVATQPPAPPTTPAPSPTSPLPTDTAPPPTETPAPTATPTLAPTSTPATFFASITGLRVENERYVVDFQTFNYQSVLPGMHIHLYFNTVPQEQAGSPGSGPWFVHGAGSPVSPYAVSEKPAAATQMCILVANPNHSIILNSGNCVNLP